MATQPNIPQTPFVNVQTGYITREWLYWILNPQIQTVIVGSPIGVPDGGTGLTGGTSGGILGFVGPTTMASSAELAANQPVLGGGAGLTPYTATWSFDQNILANTVFARRNTSSDGSAATVNFTDANNIIANQVFGY